MHRDGKEVEETTGIQQQMRWTGYLDNKTE